jgi:glycosyltransferase involved in cell wall biosynthesis
VSSSVCQLLGSGCPILFHQSNYVELQGNEIIKYRDFEDMKNKLTELFQGKLFKLTRIKDFLKDYEAERIAGRFIKLFKELRETRERRRR